MVGPSPGVRWLAVDDGLVVFIPEPATFIDLDQRGRELFEELDRHGWDVASTEELVTDALDRTNDTAASALHRLVDVLADYGFFDVVP